MIAIFVLYIHHKITEAEARVSELDELKTVLQRLSMRQQREQELENGLYAKTMVDFQTMDQE